MIYLILALALTIAFVATIYNTLIRAKNACEAAWSDIDTQLKKRYDLIPNLVETVKGAAQHEAGTLEAVTKARSAAMNAQGMQEKLATENMLTSTLKSLFALSENYPDLKANQNFLSLQNDLSGIETAIGNSRQIYNNAVEIFNNKIQVFPNNIIANMMKFNEREFFEIAKEEKKNVKVDFGTKDPAAAAPAAAAPAEAPKEEAPAAQPPAAPAEAPKEEAPAEAAKEEPPAAPEAPKEEPPAEAPTKQD